MLSQKEENTYEKNCNTIFGVSYLIIYIILLSFYWNTEKNINLKIVLLINLVVTIILFMIGQIVVGTNLEIEKKVKYSSHIVSFIFTIAFFYIIDYNRPLSPLNIFCLVSACLSALGISFLFVTFIREKYLKSIGGQKCSFCNNFITSDELITLKCTHMYHINCLRAWNAGNSSKSENKDMLLPKSTEQICMICK